MGRQIKWNKEQKCYHRHSIGCDSRPKLSVTGMNEEITTGSSKLGMGERVYIRKPLSPNTSLKYPSLGKYPWIVGEGVIRTSQRGITPKVNALRPQIVSEVERNPLKDLGHHIGMGDAIFQTMWHIEKGRGKTLCSFPPLPPVKGGLINPSGTRRKEGTGSTSTKSGARNAVENNIHLLGGAARTN